MDYGNLTKSLANIPIADHAIDSGLTAFSSRMALAGSRWERCKTLILMLLVLGISVLWNANPSFSQGVYGSIYGTAFDSSGAAVADANVVITSQEKGTSQSGKTNSVGQYRIDHLVPDTYDVAVSVPGFKTFVMKGIHVNAGDSPKVDATLEVGAISDSVTVTGAAEALLKTETMDISMTISEDVITDIPIQSRAANNLILLNPGASTYFGQWGIIPEIPQGGSWYNVSGQPQGSQSFTLDGTDNTDLMLGTIVINPSPDSLGAVKIITNNYTADIGKSNSAVLPMETKSGSNDWHGIASYFRTSNANLARNPYQASQNPPNKLPAALNNQIEGNIGGPILKNRLFFFFDYYAQRGRTGGSINTTVPTQKLHDTCLGLAATSTGVPGCDFGEYLSLPSGGGIIYQANGDPYPGNIIPASQLSQQALNFLKIIPLPQNPISLLTQNYGVSGNGVANTDQYTVRVDHELSIKMHVFGRYTYFKDHVEGASAFGRIVGGPNIVGIGGLSDGHNQSVSLGMDYSVSANLLTDVRLGYFRYRIDSVKFDQDQNSAALLGMPNLNNPKYANTGGSPGYSMGGAAAMSFGTGLAINTCNCPLQELEEQYQIVNNWTKLSGSHTFKFGVDLRYGRQFRADSAANHTGTLTFGTGPTSSLTGAGGLGFATFMLGQVSSFARAVTLAGNNAREYQKRTFFYGTDTWRITPKLTLSYGLRWEIIFPERVNGAGKGSHLDLATGNLMVAGVGDVSLNMNYKNTLGSFAPRVGLSYQLDKSSVIRVGYGRSFAMGTFGTVFAVDSTNSLPVFATQALSSANPRGSVFNLSQGPPDYVFPAVPSNGIMPLPNGTTITTRPNPLKLSTVDQWNLSYQRTITPTTTVSATYVGVKGTHVWAGIFSTVDANQTHAVLPASLSVTGQKLYYDPAIPLTVTDFPSYPGIAANGHTQNLNYLKPYYAKYGWTQGINYNANESNNHFHALQITLEKRFSNGLNINANYAWQTAKDYDSTWFVVDRKATYGPESMSKKHVFNLYGFYQLPFGKNGQFFKNVPRWADYIIGGYQISPVISIQSGLPYSVTYLTCTDILPSGAPCYANQSGELQTELGPNTNNVRSYFAWNTTVFSKPSLGQIGNSGRNSFWGPGMWNADISLSKSFHIREKITAEFRVDAFNAFNHINPGNPFSMLGIPTVSGTIRGMATNTTPRQLVFAAKFRF